MRIKHSVIKCFVIKCSVQGIKINVRKNSSVNYFQHRIQTCHQPVNFLFNSGPLQEGFRVETECRSFRFDGFVDDLRSFHPLAAFDGTRRLHDAPLQLLQCFVGIQSELLSASCCFIICLVMQEICNIVSAFHCMM